MAWQFANVPLRETYDFISPYGIASIQSWHGDRGYWKLTFDLRPPVDSIMRFAAGMFYFSNLAIVQEEAESWLELGASQPSVAGDKATLPMDLNKVSSDNLQGNPALLLPGKLCIMSVVEYLYPIHFWAIAPAVPIGVEYIFHVDWADGFPRWFINGDVAKEEAIAWMRTRGQWQTNDFIDPGTAMEKGIFGGTPT